MSKEPKSNASSGSNAAISETLRADAVLNVLKGLRLYDSIQKDLAELGNNPLSSHTDEEFIFEKTTSGRSRQDSTDSEGSRLNGGAGQVLTSPLPRSFGTASGPAIIRSPLLTCLLGLVKH